MGNRSINSTYSSPGNPMETSLRPLYTRKKNDQYPLNGNLGGSLIRFGQNVEEKNTALAGYQTQNPRHIESVLQSQYCLNFLGSSFEGSLSEMLGMVIGSCTGLRRLERECNHSSPSSAKRICIPTMGTFSPRSGWLRTGLVHSTHLKTHHDHYHFLSISSLVILHFDSSPPECPNSKSEPPE